MIPLNTNKYKLLVFLMFPYQFATATSVGTAFNYVIKTISTLKINKLDILINQPTPRTRPARGHGVASITCLEGGRQLDVGKSVASVLTLRIN